MPAPGRIIMQQVNFLSLGKRDPENETFKRVIVVT